MLLLQRANTELVDYAVALIDIGIHYHGWDLEDLNAFAEEVGLNTEAMPELYAQIQSNPTAFLSYYVGYLEFQNLREDAQDALGSSFDLTAFHEAILSTGPAPFQVVKNAVDSYVQSVQDTQKAA